MKIYEVTYPPLAEGVLGDMGRGMFSGMTGIDLPQSNASLRKDLAKSSAGLAKQGYGPGGFDPTDPKQRAAAEALSTDWKVRLKNIEKDPAVVQYITGLVQGWSQRQKIVQAKLDKAAQPTGSTPPPGAKVKPTPNIKVSGQTLTKGDDGYWYSEDGRAETRPEVVDQLDKLYHTGQRNVKGTVKEAPQEYKTPSGIVVPGGAKTDATPAPADDMKAEFIKWTDGNLASRDSSYNRITMADVRANVPGIAQELDRKLDVAVQQGYRPDAVKDYLQTAIAGVQARSRELKQKELQGDYSGAGGATPQAGAGEAQKQAQQKINKFGLGDGRLQEFGKELQNKRARSTGNEELDALIRATGAVVS
jgi:phage baseplate assembly protein gpV